MFFFCLLIFLLGAYVVVVKNRYMVLYYDQIDYTATSLDGPTVLFTHCIAKDLFYFSILFTYIFLLVI